jgi:hypothetical protein
MNSALSLLGGHLALGLPCGRHGTAPQRRGMLRPGMLPTNSNPAGALPIAFRMALHDAGAAAKARH